jgi:hypothetical protein
MASKPHKDLGRLDIVIGIIFFTLNLIGIIFLLFVPEFYPLDAGDIFINIPFSLLMILSGYLLVKQTNINSHRITGVLTFALGIVLLADLVLSISMIGQTISIFDVIVGGVAWQIGFILLILSGYYLTFESGRKPSMKKLFRFLGE